MKERKVGFFMLAIVVVFLLIGCVSDKGLAQKSAESAVEEAGIKGYDVQQGDSVKKIRTSDSESHQMIVKMRLLQYGMSPNLEDYRDAFLVEMKNEDGEAITVVVVNEDGKMKSLLPETSEN